MPAVDKLILRQRVPDLETSQELERIQKFADRVRTELNTLLGAASSNAPASASYVVIPGGLGTAVLLNERSLVAGAGLGLTDGGANGNATLAITDAELLAIAGLVSAADKLGYFTGSGTAALADLTAFARTILDDADAATVRATIGAGTGSGTIGGSSGATDNALIRANGVGGSTVQGSATTMDDTGSLTLPDAAEITWGAGDPAIRIASGDLIIENLAAAGDIILRTAAATSFNNPSVGITFQVAPVASGINYLLVNNATAAAPTIPLTATGTSADISINLVPKGTGTLQSGGTAVSLSGHTHVAANVTDFSTAVVALLTDANIPNNITIDLASTVTTNANLTGPITSVGNATSIASQTGTGTKFVVDTSPTLVTPLLGTPTSGVLTNCTGLPTAGLVDGAVTLAKMADVATATVFYRKTAATGVPEVQTLATLKTDLGLTGTNSGDQTSIVGITGTKAQFNTAVSDGDIVYLDSADTITGVKTLGTTTKLQFRDTGLFINSSVDGQLDISADTTLALTAPTSSLSGTTATNVGTVSGTTTVGVLGDIPLGGASLIQMYPQTDGMVDLGQTANRFNQLVLCQQTLGNAVTTVQSLATNDDPTEYTYQNRVATTDATVTTLHTFTIPASTTYMITAYVVARRTGGASGTAEDGAGYVIRGTYKNVAGTATLIGSVTADYTAESVAGYDATLDVTGATARLRVTGVATTNITWHMTARVWMVST